MSYNLQSVVDDKHKLIVDFDVTNEGDKRALAPMALKAKKALGLKHEDALTILADKGYHTGQQMETCHDNNIETLVAIPRKAKQTDHSKPPHLRKDNFKYNSNNHTYTCPEGHTLNRMGKTYHRKNRKGQLVGRFHRFSIKNSICQKCKHFLECVSKGNRKGHQGRYIDRTLTDKAVERNKDNVEKNKELYAKRQDIVEHPFGTIKRAWGYDYTLMKTLPKVKTEFAIILLCYNIKRSMSILGIKRLKEALLKRFVRLFDLRITVKHLTSVHFIFNISKHGPSQHFS